MLAKYSSQIQTLNNIVMKEYAAFAISQQYSQRSWLLPTEKNKKQKLTVFQEFTNLAQLYKSINLGQGIPELENKYEIVQKYLRQDKQQSKNHFNQKKAAKSLKKALHELYSKEFNFSINPQQEILISNGATECISAALESFINYGDEVILIEPFFAPYVKQVKMAGGVPVFIPLKFKKNCQDSSQIKIDFDQLKAAVNSKTKIIMLNTPQNPTGKIFSQEELQQIANIVLKQKNCYVISDEVYEFLTFGNKKHNRIANIPGMDERTITISSACKSFSYTTQKIGWCIGKANLLKPIKMAMEYLPQKVPQNLESSMASVIEEIMDKNTTYFKELNSTLEKRKNFLRSSMLKSKLKVIDCDSGYFLNLDVRNIKFPRTFTHYYDYEFSYWLTKEHGITVLPISSFYSYQHKQKAQYFVRCCFVKSEEQLKKVADKLQNLSLL